MISRTHRNNRGLALWAKLLIGFFAFCMIMFLTFCGIIGWLWYQAVNPENIKKITAEMVELEPLPAGMTYAAGLDFPKFVRLVAITDVPPATDVMVLVGFQNKNQMSAKEYVAGFTGSTRYNPEDADTLSKDKKAAQSVKGSAKSTNKAAEQKAETKEVKQSKSDTSGSDSNKVSSSDPDDKTIDDLHKHTQSPRGSNLDVQRQGELTIGGVKTPYVIGQAVNGRTGQNDDKTAVFFSAALSPDTNNIIMPVLVQRSETFDLTRAQKFLNLIKAFKNPSTSSAQ